MLFSDKGPLSFCVFKREIESAQDLVFFLQNQVPIGNAKQEKKENVETTKSTAAGIGTHDLRTVSGRPNDLTTQDRRQPAA